MSSDSEDDCYGNIAQKLSKIKNKYQEENIDTSNMLNESAELDEIVENCQSNPKKPRTSSNNSEVFAGPSVSELPDVSLDVRSSSPPMRRMTRAAAKKSNTNVVVTEMPPPASHSRRKNSSRSLGTPSVPSQGNDCSSNPVVIPTGRGRGKRRGGVGRGRVIQSNPSPRGRGGRNRCNRRALVAFLSDGDSIENLVQSCFYQSAIPTYSIGNTEEYEDQSIGQALFSKPKSQPTSDVVVIEEESSLDENEELSVKVYWQSSELCKFTIRKYQKLKQIFDFFASRENVSIDKLLFTFNDRILKPNDTPDSIGYSIVKFIDGGIVNQSLSQITNKSDAAEVKNGVKLKFQCQNVKKPVEVAIQLDDKLSVAMMKCAEYLEMPLEKLKFQFDGDSILGKSSARDLELEGGECIDVQII